MFKIKTCDDFVHTSNMITVKEVLAEQRANNPEAKIAYHSMFDIASKDKDAFGVKQIHQIFFIPAFASDEEGDRTRQSRRALWLGSSRPIPSRAHTASCRHGASSGDPRV